MTKSCKICNSNNLVLLFKETILGKYEAEYFQCEECYFSFPSKITWLEEAYDSALNIEDTGVMRRNLLFSKRLIPIFYLFFEKSSKFVDWGGGYGIFTRLMRDVGFDFFWSDKYATNLVSRGFEYKPNLKVAAITAFEVFEHLEDPINEIKEMLKITDTVIFSTELISYPAPQKKDWWYYAFEHGQHIALYNKKTLLKIANMFDLNYYSNGTNLHILTKKKHSPLFVKLVLKYAKYFYFIFKPFLNPKTQEDNEFLRRF